MRWGLTKKNDGSVSSLDEFRKDIDRVFDDFFSFKPTTLFESRWLPTVDVEEDDKAYHVKAEMPGMEEKDITVTLQNNVLTIAGEKHEERAEDKKTSIVSERSFGSFSRSFTLPEGVKADGIRAQFKKGVLTIEVPKDDTSAAKKINIEVH